MNEYVSNLFNKIYNKGLQRLIRLTPLPYNDPLPFAQAGPDWKTVYFMAPPHHDLSILCQDQRGSTKAIYFQPPIYPVSDSNTQINML